MRVIIAGTRTLRIGTDTIEKAVRLFENIAGRDVESVVCGGAPGVDKAGENWADLTSLSRAIMSADWDAHGRDAGPIQNAQMADVADGLLAIWNGKSRGTANMIKTAHAKGLLVVEVRLPGGFPK